MWGWDYPLATLALARLGWRPEPCVAALLRPSEKNAYSRAGVNQGMGNATAYFPGNGGTLLAVAALAAGFDVGPPGEALAKGGPGAMQAASAPTGFPAAWNAVAEGFNVPLP